MNNTSNRSTITWLVLASDIIGLIVCFYLAFIFRLEKSLNLQSPLLYGLILIYILGLHISDTYKLSDRESNFWVSGKILLGIIGTVSVITSLIYITGLWGSEAIVGRGILLISVILFIFWAITSRILASKWLKKYQISSRFLVLGKGKKTLTFVNEYHSEDPSLQFIFLLEENLATELIGQNSLTKSYLSNSRISIQTEPKSQLISDRNILIDSLKNFNSWSSQNWSGVIVEGQNKEISASITRELMSMRLRGVYIYSFADFCEHISKKVPPVYLEDDWFTYSSGFSILHHRVNLKLKQAIDFLAAAMLIIITLPITLLAAIAIKLESPGSLFYSQVRTGLNGKTFKVHKFRSMRQDAEKMGVQWAQKKDPRITRVGNFLRKTRIDELPQLWNILKGEMSLIGPRPERPEFDRNLRQEIPYYDLRYLIKPGISGWAQVCYPYGASVEDAYQKVAYDLYYIKNYSLLLDGVIALKTLRVVFLGKGR